MFSSLEMPHSVLMLLLMCCASVHYYAMYSPDANAAVHCFCTIFFLMLLQIVMQFHRVKVHFSRKYIRRHHLFVLYKYEAGVTLECYSKCPEAWLHICFYPGKPFASVKLRILPWWAFDALKLVLDPCNKESEGWSLGGLRGKDFKKTTPLMAERDYQSLSLIFTKELFGSVPIPDELGAWLDLLCENPLSHVDLITEHMFLLEDDEKITKYIILFQKLQQAKISAMTFTRVHCQSSQLAIALEDSGGKRQFCKAIF